MSEQLPVVNARKVERALRRLGWVEHRHSSNHVIFRRTDGTGRVVLPRHAGKDIAPGTLESIIDQAGVTAEEFKEHL